MPERINPRTPIAERQGSARAGRRSCAERMQRGAACALADWPQPHLAERGAAHVHEEDLGQGVVTVVVAVADVTGQCSSGGWVDRNKARLPKLALPGHAGVPAWRAASMVGCRPSRDGAVAAAAVSASISTAEKM
jgi:hypothetical protein